ncbi:hypothetical protein [Lutibacter sp.]|uniref:hypothetical protein n=1 Tax=Lutibacter sp. TaxID=1925666 RepID=UPI0025C5ED18|nr:hypothetical protein [Lutibacter sp.]MCF6181123.1 hypothetical protein [Lutibacter sp.]
MKDNLENIFKKFENQFDLEEPTIEHFNRFEAKLNKPKKKNYFRLFKITGILSMAASILLFFGIWIGSNQNNSGAKLSSVSPKMTETENYFITTIKNEIQLVEKEKNSSNQQLITDSFNQLKKLEKNYKLLAIDLKENKSDPRIIYAMIANYQQRIIVLQSLIQQLNDIKQLKTQTHEKYV